MITRLTTQRWLDVGTSWTEDEHRSAHARMVYEYRATCSAHYYGKGCENLCRPRDDSFGHYSCSPTGERVCLSGWKGDYCATREYIYINFFIFHIFINAVLLYTVLSRYTDKLKFIKNIINQMV